MERDKKFFDCIARYLSWEESPFSRNAGKEEAFTDGYYQGWEDALLNVLGNKRYKYPDEIPFNNVRYWVEYDDGIWPNLDLSTYNNGWTNISEGRNVKHYEVAGFKCDTYGILKKYAEKSEGFSKNFCNPYEHYKTYFKEYKNIMNH